MAQRNQGKPSSREIERVSWLEFGKIVPAKINTVLLPLGTIEAHGVIPNGTDIIIPVAIAKEIAQRVNAMIAPVIPYGFTGTLDAYPGCFTVPEEVYRSYVRSVLIGLTKSKFKNIILLNGHGGGQTAILAALAQEVGRETGTRMLVINWWSYCSDIVQEVFGEDGGHAGNTETAYIMAVDASLVRKQDYKSNMATAMPAPNTWSAYPFPSSIMLYKNREGLPVFDAEKAKTFFDKVNDKVARLIEETIVKWDLAGL
jgi:creatinine amidohydrolase